MLAVGLALIGVNIGAVALPPWIIAVLTTVFIAVGVFWLNRKGGCLTAHVGHADLNAELSKRQL